VVFPFEKAFYESHDVQVSYVGHPLTKTIQLSKSREHIREGFGIAPHQKLVALMPGSRYSELNTLLPIMIQASEAIVKQNHGTVFILAAAPTISDEALEALCKNSSVPIRIVRNDTYHIVHAADACITASGTATLETALLNTPMVIVYKVNTFTAMMVKWMLKIPYISLCNIVAGDAVVKELLQEYVTAKSISDEVLKILHDETYRNTMKGKLSGIRDKLGELDAADNVADIAIKMITS
jgi:lipid-A-disaccharide synthase